MKIVSELNGTTRTTSYGNKLFYRESPNNNYTQIKRAFYRESPSDNYTQVYLFDETPPVITITSSGSVVTSSYYVLTGYITETESGIAAIYVNNNPITWSGNSFSYPMNIGYGRNNITIKCVDVAGNSSQIVHTVFLKNTSVITWDDTITMEVTYGGGQYVGWLTGGTDGPHYSGNRNSNSCSVSGSSYAIRGQNEYVADSCWAMQLTHGRIYAGARTITISSSRSWEAEGGNTYGLPDEWAKIYDSAGNVVANIGNGTTYLNGLNDGSYYFYVRRGSGSYGAWAGGSCSSNCTVTINP